MYLPTLDFQNEEVEIGFLGGNFTGIPLDAMCAYLSFVQTYLDKYSFKGIRVSTRPDYIDKKIIDLCTKYRVSTIELGTQSMHDDVLRKSGRGHTVSQSIEAVKRIKDAGIAVGMQMMVGLPGDTKQKSLETARQIISQGADCTRIYPTLVIKNTELYKMFNSGKYRALTMEEAVDWCVEPYLLFEEAGVDIIRVGLHPSEGLMSGDDLADGPFHISFRELVLSEIWKRMFDAYNFQKADRIEIFVIPRELNYAVGYHGLNRDMLLKQYKEVKFRADSALKGRDFYVRHH